MAKPPHLLLVGPNVRRVKTNLATVIDQKALDAIEAEILANSRALYRLGHRHFTFAVRQSNRDWRQKISRLYYGVYNSSRAIRLCVAGEYSTDPSDHAKIESIPDDLPNRSKYENQLRILREDRNLSDYDHTAGIADLALGIAGAVEMASAFMVDSKVYLKKRGVKL